MNKKYTLKELADIGAENAWLYTKGPKMNLVRDGDDSDQDAREEFTKAILDAIGYEFPKDEEREAFDRWSKTHHIHDMEHSDAVFAAWKAGREELKRAINKPSCSMPTSYGGIALLASQQVPLTTEQQRAVDACLKEEMKPKEPAWILWEGGKCPLPDTVKKWEVRFRDQQKIESASSPSQWRWSHNGCISDIVAYRVWPE